MAGNATGTPSPTTTAGKLPTHDRGRGHGSENVPHHPGRHSRHASLNDAYSDSPTHAYAYAHARTTPSAGDSPTISAPATADETAMVVDETSSLMSGRSSTCSHDSDDLPPTASHHHSLYADVRGWELLPKIEFWQLVALLGLLSGIGLMTINNIGNDVKSLWLHWDRDATPGFIQKQQVLQVSILSIFSCGGRLLSGIGSDILVNKLHLSRVWCLFASSLIFCFAQVAATQIVNPHHLMIISSTTGLAYGFLFGVAPSIVAHVFGVGGLSQNWGILCLAPVLSGNVFNLMYGSIYDHHSIIGPTGERVCLEGVGCYRATYEFAVLVGCAGAAVSLWTIWHERRLVQRLHGGKERD
ncbi:hypothetical protein KEM52_006550 [Ascosphaera acerosa]|nr:hypothetical protein KEM52_006550 [Ascosphaera acerosa]